MFSRLGDNSLDDSDVVIPRPSRWATLARRGLPRWFPLPQSPSERRGPAVFRAVIAVHLRHLRLSLNSNFTPFVLMNYEAFAAIRHWTRHRRRTRYRRRLTIEAPRNALHRQLSRQRR